MSLYEILLFLHIGFAILWLGAAVSLVVLGVMADRTNDPDAMRTTLDHNNRLATVYFVPSSLLVLVFGIALVVESEAWSFGQLWIVLGLIGYGFTFLTGIAVLKPRGERMGRMVAEAGGAMTPEAMLEGRRILMLARTDQVVLFLVVLDMVAKPTGDDVGLLVAMAAILVAGAAYFTWRARSLGPGAPAGQTA